MKSVREGEYTAPPAVGPHDHGDLGYDAREQDVAEYDLAVAREAGHTLLDASAAGVVETHDGSAVLGGQVHHLGDFLAHHLGYGAPEHGEILRENERETAVHTPVACDDCVSQVVPLRQSQVRRAMRDERVQLTERALVQERVDSLPGRQLALCVLLIYAGLTASKGGLFPQLTELFQPLGSRFYECHLPFPNPFVGFR